MEVYLIDNIGALRTVIFSERYKYNLYHNLYKSYLSFFFVISSSFRLRDFFVTFKEKELQRVWATIADGVYSSSRSKAAQIRSPVLRYVHKALANTFFARKATGTINEGELKFLDMGIKPFSHAQAMARGSRGDRSDTGNLMPFLDHSSPTRSQLTTLGTKEEESLVLEGSSHLSCVLLE
ncbi:unnamed protein product [Microthlaspi erraticum]|uniref:Arabidopsis retrotransposon Orf1 C-terminal domain-containing protein n=1 Tax=Microthlaspi erraticum TaxID=1685480 RepID=A0A6D2KZ62_9BRAS|nr:unnamed protein product [Microthlaspi erraticum]